MAFQIEDVRPLLQGLRGLRQGWASKTADALTRVQTILHRIAAELTSLQTRVSGLESSAAGTVVSIQVKRFTVTANLTVGLPDEPIGSVFLYVFVTDGAGSWSITLPAEFKGLYSPITMEATAGNTNSFMVLKNSDIEYVPVMTGIENVRIT